MAAALAVALAPYQAGTAEARAKVAVTAAVETVAARVAVARVAEAKVAERVEEAAVPRQGDTAAARAAARRQ